MDQSQTATEPDLTLLGRFIETGDPAVFAEIVRRYARVVYSASLRVLGDEARAQDVSQETFFRLMRQPRIVTQSLGGWLHRSATHLAMDVRRSERSRRAREIAFAAQQQMEREEEPAWAEISPMVDEALDALEEPARSLLIRHFLQGVPQAELAVELGSSPATISRRIKAGIEQLRLQLRGKGVRIGLAALAGFCATHTTEAAPPAFLAELGKINLIASLREPAGSIGGSSASTPTASFPPTLKMRIWPPEDPIATWMIVGTALLIAAYLAILTVSFINGHHGGIRRNSQPQPGEHVQK